MTRLVIAGGPRTGKTTLARALLSDSPFPSFALSPSKGLRVLHTDDVIDLGWSEASAEVSRWLDLPGPWIIEGVAAPRALRKWLDRNPTGTPCDGVIWLAHPWETLSEGQERMRRGCLTVMAGIQDELERRGVPTVQASDPRKLSAAIWELLA